MPSHQQRESSPYTLYPQEIISRINDISPEDCTMIAKIAGYDKTVPPRIFSELTKRDFDMPAYFVAHFESSLPDTDIYSDMYMQLRGPMKWHQKLPGLLVSRIVQINDAWLLDTLPNPREVRYPYIPAAERVILPSDFPLTRGA